jgi:hypothetical protein
MPYTRQDVQVRLKNLGFYQGKIDGDIGPASCEAIMAALSSVKAFVLPKMPEGVVPQDWMQAATIDRIILHWTVGKHEPSEYDKDHYHILVSGKGKVVRGNCDISGNSSTAKKGKTASHTKDCNTGSLGISLAGMIGAEERPLNLGAHPITKEQWDMAAVVAAELCKRYKVPVTPRTVLSHAEVQANLGIQQRGKWDVAILPWDRTFDTARECGDLFRKLVQEHLNKL